MSHSQYAKLKNDSRIANIFEKDAILSIGLPIRADQVIFTISKLIGTP